MLNVAASALGNDTMAAAVVDRTGNILGVYTRAGGGRAYARTSPSASPRSGAMFANDQAPLSSRTVRFISGIHFPPGVRNTPPAALYGVENINRGCRVDALGDAVFNTPVPRPKSIAGTFGAGAGVPALPCEPLGHARLRARRADARSRGPRAVIGRHHDRQSRRARLRARRI